MTAGDGADFMQDPEESRSGQEAADGNQHRLLIVEMRYFSR